MRSSKKSLMLKISMVLLAILLTFSYIKLKKPKLAYAPFAINAEKQKLNIIKPDAIMEGTPEGDLMIAIPEGSKIFAKAGLNYVVAKEGKDEIYHSLCSTKIIAGKVGVIEGFDPKEDKLKIFCAHHKVQPSQIRIVHDSFKGKPITYVEIQGKHSLAAIALLGDIDIKVDDIILNKKWEIPLELKE